MRNDDITIDCATRIVCRVTDDETTDAMDGDDINAVWVITYITSHVEVQNSAMHALNFDMNMLNKF